MHDLASVTSFHLLILYLPQHQKGQGGLQHLLVTQLLIIFLLMIMKKQTWLLKQLQLLYLVEKI